VDQSERILRCLDNDVSILIGSVDAAGEPSCCRALALTSIDDLATLTVYVPEATSRDAIASLAATRRIAVVATHPISHYSIQLKGVARDTRIARPDEEPIVRHGFGGFADVLNTIGVPRRVTKAVTLWPALAIEVDVQEIYDQTPGPKAGTRLR